MSDTRNHTTRDQLAEAFRSVAWLEYQDGRTEWAAFEDDLLDALEPVIAAVRAAAVAETTAAIEALAARLLDPTALVTEGPMISRLKAASMVRAALSGGRTALDTAKAAAWDEALEAVANERGSFGMQTRNPYRADTGADQ